MINDSDVRWLDEAEDQTWIDLWSMMVWLPTRLDAQLRTDAGLSLAEYNVLSQLSMTPGREAKLSNLAVVANTTLSHLSRVISRMEKAGWVERRPDPSDGRSTLGVLTDDGMRKVERSAPDHVAAVRRYVFDNLTREQALALGESAAAVVAEVAPPRIARSSD